MTMTRRRFLKGALQAAAVGAGLGTVGAGFRFSGTASASHPGLVQPSYGDLENYNILSYSNLAFDNGVNWGSNWDKTAEFRVSPRGEYAYTSNYQGFSILDVSEPDNPYVISRVKNSPTVQSQYIDVSGDLLIVNQEGLTNQPNPWQGGIRLFDVSDPYNPREVGFFQTDQTRPEGEGETFRLRGGRGVHGFWIHEDPYGAGKFCIVCTSSLDPATGSSFYGNIVVIVDINDPANPHEVGRWWYPGQGPGEVEQRVENQTDTNQPLPKIWVFAHDLTTYHDRLYIGYRDVGVQILDISDLTKPEKVGEIAWTQAPYMQANTHSVGIVVPKDGGRPETIVATDEIGSCPYGWLHIIDVRNEGNPKQISELKLPLNEVANCSLPDRPGRRFSIHDVDRLIRGEILHSAWEEAGFWAIDISDLAHPKAVGHYVPPVRSDSPSKSGHADDVFVLDNGLVFGSSSDTGAGGLWIMRRTPGVKGTVSWNATETDVIVNRKRG